MNARNKISFQFLVDCWTGAHLEWDLATSQCVEAAGACRNPGDSPDDGVVGHGLTHGTDWPSTTGTLSSVLLTDRAERRREYVTIEMETQLFELQFGFGFIVK